MHIYAGMSAGGGLFSGCYARWTFTLKGVAYITGAGSGIGTHTAYSMARQGTVKGLRRIFPEVSAQAFELDVTDEKAVNESIAQTVKEFGRLDYAVNNAGVGGIINTTDQIPKEDFEKVVAVNTIALTVSYHSNRGSSVNVASMLGFVAPPLNVPTTAYATSKHAVIGLTNSDALALLIKAFESMPLLQASYIVGATLVADGGDTIV
ncbi:NAD(P)-binding protein [Plenodomus tracheiphilus IPT5]|uniref:NAD(P)-binding protein n=1 Tax=Plenodomus tracheiphilus IPT5 TaxID=1408161 RepID=A0A6A7BAN8_9PLEO|nr:NAD(P)-binding protein [Plenodomus tracheiphilus IPT5]